MTKVALAGEHHDDTRGVGGVDHFLVAHRPARLYDGGDTGTGERLESIGEREERVGRGARAHGELTGLGRGDTGRHDPRLLTGPDAYRDAVTRDHDGVGRRSCADPPRNLEVLKLLGRRRGDGYAAPLVNQGEQFVGVLY